MIQPSESTVQISQKYDDYLNKVNDSRNMAQEKPTMTQSTLVINDKDLL